MGSAPEKRLAKNEECAVFYRELTSTLRLMMERMGPGERAEQRVEKRGRKPKNPEARAQEPVGDGDAVHRDVIEKVFEGYDIESLRRLRSLVAVLGNLSMSVESRVSASVQDYLEFIRQFCDIYDGTGNPMGHFMALLGYSTDPASFEVAGYKIFKILFFRQNPPKIAFYDVSLAASLWRAHFRDSAYFRSILRRMCYNFVVDTGLTHVANGRYVISRQFMREFAEKIEALVNAFNGLVSEMPIDGSAIPKIVFVFLIFHIERRSVFLSSFGEPELFYCVVRTFYSGTGFAKRLENFIKTRLLWEFRTEDTGYTIDRLFQTVYKYEYKRFIGSIKPARIISGKYSTRSVGVPSCSISQERRAIKTSVLNVTPRVNRARTVSAFSPLSQRIGEVAGIRDNFDSKRRLNFK